MRFYHSDMVFAIKKTNRREKQLMKWYEQKYVNHRDWILDNIELLNLTHTDLITVLVIH